MDPNGQVLLILALACLVVCLTIFFGCKSLTCVGHKLAPRRRAVTNTSPGEARQHEV